MLHYVTLFTVVLHCVTFVYYSVLLCYTLLHCVTLFNVVLEGPSFTALYCVTLCTIVHYCVTLLCYKAHPSLHYTQTAGWHWQLFPLHLQSVFASFLFHRHLFFKLPYGICVLTTKYKTLSHIFSKIFSWPPFLNTLYIE